MTAFGVASYAAGTTGVACGVSLVAQAAPSVPDGTPTTIVGAVITALMISLGLVSWVVKRLFDELKDSREKFGATLDKVEKSADDRADKIEKAVDADGKENREQRRREAEQEAELRDRHREQQALEHQVEKELMNQIFREIQRIKP